MKKITPFIGLSLCLANSLLAQKQPPNILFIMSDDHTTQAVSAYGGPLKEVFQTPNIDRIGQEGIIFENCLVTNAICTPSRATILTGQYSHHNGVYTLKDPLDRDQDNIAKRLQASGYETAVMGKWHLKTEPSGFDHYNVLKGQGLYNNPLLKEKGKWEAEGKSFEDARGTKNKGYSTDVISGLALDWLKERDGKKPFFMMCHFKAPHRNWMPAKRFENMFDGVTIPEPESLYEDHSERSEWAPKSYNTIRKDMKSMDLGIRRKNDTLQGAERTKMAYQLYMKRYLACVAAVDENVGKILDYLDENGLAENTIIVYTGDQGFFLGEHGWFDKRSILEESLRMPLLIRYPKGIEAGQWNKSLVSNVDFAPTFLDMAGASPSEEMDGASFAPMFEGKTPKNWRDAFYYRYWMQLADHGVPAHYGIRTDKYKLIFYYGRGLDKAGTVNRKIDPFNKDSEQIGNTTPEWEFYDLSVDPKEMVNKYQDPEYKQIIRKLKKKLLKEKKRLGDSDEAYPEMIEANKYWD